MDHVYIISCHERYAVFRDDEEKQEPMHTVAKVLNNPMTQNSYF